jgi:hypothetical protein
MEGLIQFLLGILVGAVGVALTPWVKHVVPQPGRRKVAMQAIERAIADHELWRQRANMAIEKELAAVDEDAVARGIFASGIHTDNRQAVSNKYAVEREQELRRVLRASDDALAQLGPFERRRVKQSLAGRKVDDESLEVRLFGEPEM